MTEPTYLKVVGIDPSLSSLGLATAYTDGRIVTSTIRPGKATGCQRLDDLRTTVRRYVDTFTLVVIEGPSHGSPAAGRQKGHHERAGLWWLLAHMLWRNHIDYAVCPPATRAKWATGRGNANKDAVLLACERRFPAAEVSNNNEADAAILAAMGAHVLGWLVDQPKYSGEALLKVQWPDAITAALLHPYEVPVPLEEAVS